MTASVARALGLIVLCRLCAPAGTSAVGPRTKTIELRLTTYASVGAADVTLARRTTATLMGTAGVEAAWVDCGDNRDQCAVADANTFPVRINLLPTARQDDGTICGEATRDALTRIPTVLVYVPRSRELVLRVQHTPSGRSHSLLSTLQAGHLLGLTIAHELGHVLGVAHSARGVMRAHPDIGDILALRASSLTFSPAEAARMRSAIAEP